MALNLLKSWTEIGEYGLISGTIAPARELPDFGGSSEATIRLLLANAYLIVPVACSILVVIVAVFVLCFFRDKRMNNKGKKSQVIQRFVCRYYCTNPTWSNCDPWVPAVDSTVDGFQYLHISRCLTSRLARWHDRHLLWYHAPTPWSRID